MLGGGVTIRTRQEKRQGRRAIDHTVPSLLHGICGWLQRHYCAVPSREGTKKNLWARASCSRLHGSSGIINQLSACRLNAGSGRSQHVHVGRRAEAAKHSVFIPVSFAPPLFFGGRDVHVAPVKYHVQRTSLRLWHDCASKAKIDSVSRVLIAERFHAKVIDRSFWSPGVCILCM